MHIMQFITHTHHFSIQAVFLFFITHTEKVGLQPENGNRKISRPEFMSPAQLLLQQKCATHTHIKTHFHECLSQADRES